MMAATSPAFTVSDSPSRIFLPSTSTCRFLMLSIDQLSQIPAPIDKAHNFDSVLDLAVENEVWPHRKVPQTFSDIRPRLADLRVLTQHLGHLPKTLDDFDGCLRIAIE